MTGDGRREKGEKERKKKRREEENRKRDEKKKTEKKTKNEIEFLLAPVERVDEVVVEPQHRPDVDGPSANEAVELRREHGGAPEDRQKERKKKEFSQSRSR